MIWLLAALTSVIAVVAIVALIGLQLPPQHVVSRTRRYPVSIDAVWDVISDVLGAAAWRSDLKAVEPVDLDHWREVSTSGRSILYERVEAHAPARLVVRIADPDLPFSGSWTFEISEDGSDAAWLTISENGTVRNPVFRFLSRYLFSQTKSLDTYLDSLEKRL